MADWPLLNTPVRVFFYRVDVQLTGFLDSQRTIIHAIRNAYMLYGMYCTVRMDSDL